MSAKFPTVAELARGATGHSAVPNFHPYWWEAAPREQYSQSSLPALPAKADVVVVGSGFTGLSAALTLGNHGRSVVVIDSGVPGFGASTRNGGQVGSGNQKFRVKRLIELRGERKATEMLREGTRMLDYIEHLITSESISCAFRRCGRFRAAMQPEHFDAMARDLDDLKKIAGVESFMVPRSEQRSEIGSDIFYGGSVIPNDACVHPGLYHLGLMTAVRNKGGALIGNCRVERIETNGKAFRVNTVRGEIVAQNVIIATNGYTQGLVPELSRRIVPIGSGLIATEALPHDLYDRLLPKNRVYGNTNRVFYYFRGAPEERRIIWGGRAGRMAANTHPRAFRHLAADMLRVFPDLAAYAVTHSWDGKIGYTFDEVPHLGQASSGVHYALGYCGTGVSRATYFGHKVAQQVLGDPDGRTAFDELKFPAFPVHPIAVQAVPVVETWYRLRDATKL